MKCFRPVASKYQITSGFGEVNPKFRDGLPHKGIDFGCPIGTEAWACFDGTVQVVRRLEEGTEKQQRAGNRVIILAEDGKSRALYFHLSTFKCQVGQKVKKGEAVALTGDTGVVTGPHLHFELRAQPGDEAFPPEFEEVA